MQKLNEGMIDKIAQGLFKFLFKNEINKAENYVKQISDKISDNDRKELQNKLNSIEKDSMKLQQILDSAR